MNDAAPNTQQNSAPLDHVAIRAIMLGIMLAMFLSALEQTIVAPALATIGRTLGGVLTDYVHWTMIFWINLPMGLLALWMTDRALKQLPRHDRPHKLDMLGALLMVGAALALMLAMTWGGQTRGGTHYGWASAPILSLLAGAVVLWLLFALRMARAPEPFI